MSSLHPILSFFIYIILYICAFALLVFLLDFFLKSKGYKGPKSDHFNGKHFFNNEPIKDIDDPADRKGLISWLMRREQANEKPAKWKHRKITPSIPQNRVMGGNIAVTFVNHATVLIQTEGLNILTDPIWAKRASPFQWIGPGRYQAPGIRFKDLPPIDIILLSHNHYDHMDISTLRRLKNAQIFTSLGNAHYLKKYGIKKVIEMDWMDRKPFSVGNETNATIPVDIRAVRAQHFSARAFSDRNKSLWCGFVLETPHGDIYFAGDTGYGTWVKKIADKYPKGFRLALIPIGAFKPRSFMKEVHASPDEAWKIKDELQVKEAIAIHHGTFKMASDNQDEPRHRIEEISKEKNDQTFHVLNNGESRFYDFTSEHN